MTTDSPTSADPGQPQRQAAQSVRTNGAAITAFVLALISVPLLLVIVGIPTAIMAVIIGAVAISQINKSRTGPDVQQGKGLAIAGIVVGALVIVAAVAVFVGIVSIPIMLKDYDKKADAFTSQHHAVVIQTTVPAVLV
jgi:Domain of unknown function (DUF4190)